MRYCFGLYVFCMHIINVSHNISRQAKIDLRDFVKKTIKEFRDVDILIEKLQLRFLYSHGDDFKITLILINELKKMMMY